MAEKFYITTSIPYVNSRPHLGHALEFVQADAVARWARLAGREVHFLSGADEHGAKIVRAAEASGQPVEKFVDANTDVFKKLIQKLEISASDFIRTSEERHFTGAQSLWKRLDEAGDIYKKSYRGLYCVGHEAFVTQKDLVGGKCADHGAEPLGVVYALKVLTRQQRETRQTGQGWGRYGFPGPIAEPTTVT